MKEHDITVRDIAKELGRSVGYVSEHTSGASAPDTDLLDAVAALITFEDGQACRTEDLVRELVTRLDSALALQMFQTVVEVTKNPPPAGVLTRITTTDAEATVSDFPVRGADETPLLADVADDERPPRKR